VILALPNRARRPGAGCSGLGLSAWPLEDVRAAGTVGLIRRRPARPKAQTSAGAAPSTLMKSRRLIAQELQTKFFSIEAVRALFGAPLGGKRPIDMYFPSIVIPSNLPVPFTTCQVPSAFAASPFRAYTPKNLSPAAFTCSHAPNEAMSTMNTTNERWFEAEANRVAGEIALKSFDIGSVKAEAYFERALSVARQQQAKSWELRAAMSMTMARSGQAG
jgi:hypothetical protein